MEFSEKFKVLLSLTATKSVNLASSVNIDTAQISRMKTGTRKMPRDTKLLRDISDYLAGRFDNEYRLSALYELTSDMRLQSSYDRSTLTSIVYDWLISPEEKTNSHAGEFLKRLNDFPSENSSDDTLFVEESTFEDESNFFTSFSKNEGKRQAIKEFFNYAMALENPGTIRIFTDESEDWLFEDSKYSKEITEGVKLLVEKGFHFQRVQPPLRNMEGTFRDIQRWIPAYVAGAIRMFYYPWSRDELHRRTIFVLPYHIAACSASLYGHRDSGITLLTTKPDAVDAFNTYYDGILERCATTMNVFMLDDSEKILERIQNISKIKEPGVYKSYRLSAHTLPRDVIASVIKRGSPYVQKVMECYGQTEKFKAEVLENNSITDIMCLPKLENVMNGKEPIPGTEAGNNTEYYTPEEYLHHINHIMWYLRIYANYRVVLMEEYELESVIVYTKGNNHALLIKRAHPFTLFEFTDRTLCSAISLYLRKIADEKICSSSHEEVMRRLKTEAARVEAMIKQKR